MPLNMGETSGDSIKSGAAGAGASTATVAVLSALPSSSSVPTSPVRPVYPTLDPAHASQSVGSVAESPKCCHDRLYGPHTSTIRMNPYVRCVHGSGVPEIRSLKELLSLKVQPDPAEPDTPCLRPSHGPSSTWRQPGSFSGAMTADPSGTSQDGVTNAAAGSHAGRHTHAPSPMLAFTADSVATPNTFATVVTHEKRIISHLTRRLRNSVKRHQDMPMGEPMEMVLSEGDEEEGNEEEDEGEVLAEEGAEGQFREEIGDDSCNADIGEVPLLPCSTREKAAEAAAVAAAAAASGTPSVGTSSSSSFSRANLTPPPERSPARPCSPVSAEHQQQRYLQTNNERIVSPHSTSGMLCEFPGSQLMSDVVSQQHQQQHHHSSDSSSNAIRLPPHAHSASNLHGLRAAAPRSHRTHSAHPLSQSATAAPLRSYPAPVARLEESPYHYIMRNYIGGTFLYYSTAESKDYFLRLCHRVVAQVRPILEQETLSPSHGLFPRINAPAYVFGDIHGNFEDLSFFLRRLLIFHDFNLTPANILCLGDYVDRGPFSLECVMLLFSLKIMNASKIVMLRGNHEDRVVCGDLQTYGRGCFLGQCQTVFGYAEGMKLFREVTALFKYLPLAAELVIPSTPNIAFLRSQQTVMHPNLYVSQPAVLLHDVDATGPAKADDNAHSPASAFVARRPHPGGEVASGESGDDSLSKSTASLTPTHAGSPTTAAAAAGYSTITDSSLTRGQPSRHEAHEERILCTHGGIPRFDRPPLEENALNSLRSLAFPRMLTLFPNNPMVKDDPECAPDHFAQRELQALWRRFPSTAPPEFTAALRREASEAAAASAAVAALHSAAGPLPSCTVKSRKLTSCASSASCTSGSNAEEGRTSPDDKAEQCEPPPQLGRSSSASSVSSSLASAGPQRGSGSAPADGRALLRRCNSRDFLPSPTDEDVRKAWYTMFDLLWSDPTPMEVEEEEAARKAAAAAANVGSGVAATTTATAVAPRVLINEWGFGINTRGSNVVSFSAKAVDTFLTAHHYSMLFRAHQEKAHGLRWSKSNKVLTIFSSSNYMGHRNGAGCVVVAANGEVQMVEKVCLQ